MTQKTSAPADPAGRRTRFCALVLGLAATVMASPAAFGGEFELEGDILDNVGGADPTDWSALFNPGNVNTPPSPLNSFPADVQRAQIVRDFTPGSKTDTSIFATGSKDTLNPAPFNGDAAGWQCKSSNNVGDAVDIVNAYAALQFQPDGSDPGTDPDVVLLFGTERFSNNGDSNVGFWFVKDPNIGCTPGQGGATDFTGNHQDGDLFIVSEFSQGGVVSTINAYVWQGGPGGGLNTTPVASGIDCKSFGNPPAADICATVNASTLTGFGGGTDIPWYVETKGQGNTPSNNLPARQFFEGKLNLSTQNLVACFSSFLANTRSATSLTATIFDFAFGTFEVCEISAAKACATGVDPNPEVVGGTSLKYTFDAVVSNAGIATIHDVEIQEAATAGSGESCQLIAIDGIPTGPTNLYGTPNPWVDVATTLSAGNSVTATIECVDSDNPFANSINIRAKTSAALTSFDLTDSYTMTNQDTCQANVSPMVGIDKVCTDLALDYTAGDFGVAVSALIRVENTDANGESLESVVVSDSDDASLDPVVCPANWATCSVSSDPFACSPGASTTFDGTLDPSETACFAASYISTAADNNQTDPSMATFSDTANVTAVGAISGTSIGVDPQVTATATCPLCPPCPDCN